MPSLTASAFIPDSELSSAARHIAHCADAGIGDNTKIIANRIYVVLRSIIWGNHNVNYNTGYRNVQPNWIGDSCNFTVAVELL